MGLEVVHVSSWIGGRLGGMVMGSAVGYENGNDSEVEYIIYCTLNVKVR